MLDAWQFWNRRALFDTARRSTGSDLVPPQIIARCNFCNQSVSYATLAGSAADGSQEERGRNPPTSAGSTAGNLINSRFNRSTTCPNCRKPLPRCVLCLLNLGMDFANSETDLTLSTTRSVDSHGALGIENWFSWCQTCRHGGHAAHLQEWFKDHVACPAADCNCRCNRIDRNETGW